jgi:hypothetical protein
MQFAYSPFWMRLWKRIIRSHGGADVNLALDFRHGSLSLKAGLVLPLGAVDVKRFPSSPLRTCEQFVNGCVSSCYTASVKLWVKFGISGSCAGRGGGDRGIPVQFGSFPERPAVLLLIRGKALDSPHGCSLWFWISLLLFSFLVDVDGCLRIDSILVPKFQTRTSLPGGSGTGVVVEPGEDFGFDAPVELAHVLWHELPERMRRSSSLSDLGTQGIRKSLYTNN